MHNKNINRVSLKTNNKIRKTRIPLDKNVEVSVEVVDDWMPKFDNDYIEPIDSEPITYYNVRIKSSRPRIDREEL